MTDESLLQRPIVILGAPRSGTSLMSQLLSRHPDLHLVDEPRILWKYGNDGRSDMLTAQHATPRIKQHIRREFAKRVRDSGATRLLEKTPSNSLRVPFVDQVLNDCVFVHVLRSGAQSVLSIRDFWQKHSTGVPSTHLLRRLREIRPSQIPYYGKEFARRALGKLRPGVAGPAVWGPRLPGIEAMARDMDLLDVCAQQWRACVESACREGRMLPPDRYTELPLEGLNEEQLCQIMDFCGLRPSDEVLQAYRKMFDNTAPSGRTGTASEADLQHVTDLVAPTTAWLATLPSANRHSAVDGNS